MEISDFRKTVLDYYRTHGRSMPWRENVTAYRIVVSEIMLQQTQVHRVVPKFESWMKRFPDWESLAKAPTKEVLQEWAGLGYNRRALYLKEIAMSVDAEYFPETFAELIQLPGIGPNTAGSILAFAYNIPYPFIETNIRSVFIHFFFLEIEKAEGRKACKKIKDDEIMPYIEEALKSGFPKKNPREWYWALMDYGAMLKKSLPNPSRRSAHHVKQSKFEGSNRQLRSRILTLVMARAKKYDQIMKELPGKPDEAVVIRNLEALVNEGFIVRQKRTQKYIPRP